MRAVTALRTCLILFWVLGILGVVVGIQQESQLPPELQLFLMTDELGDEPPGGLFLTVAFLVLFLVFIVSSVALFRLRRWGAWGLLVSNGLLASLTVFFGPTVEPPGESALDELSIICSGIAIGIAFFGHVLKKPHQPRVVPAGEHCVL